MKKLIKTYFTSACITFTLTMLATTVLNLLMGYSTQSNAWILVLLAYISAIELLDYGMSFLDFSSYKAYFMTELILSYILMLVAGYFGHWFDFRLVNIIVSTIIFLVIYCCVHGYFNRIRRYEADEINALIANNTTLQ